jgi:UDP-N-acetylglucosamine:LPS N-acetylglucosamine transferase
LSPAFEHSEIVYATTREGYRIDIGFNEFRVVPDANRSSKINLIISCLAILRLLLAERPDVVISTGAAPGYLAVRLGKWLGARTIWVDSVANAEELSMSGKKAGKFVDLWLTQWAHLAKTEGPFFYGSVL